MKFLKKPVQLILPVWLSLTLWAPAPAHSGGLICKLWLAAKARTVGLSVGDLNRTYNGVFAPHLETLNRFPTWKLALVAGDLFQFFELIEGLLDSLPPQQ